MSGPLPNIFGFEAPSDDYACDPYPHLARLLESAPRYFCAERNTWFVSCYDDIVTLLRDERLTITRSTSFTDQSQEFREVVVYRLRTWFASSQAELAAIVESVTDRCIDRLIGRHDVDLVEDLAQAAPSEVMAELLGIPLVDLPGLRRLGEATLRSYDLDWIGKPAPEPAVLQFFHAYFQRHWRIAPETGLMSLLRAAQSAHDLPDASMIDVCMKLFSAGTTTTAGCIANVLARLASSDDASVRLLDEPPSAQSVEALLKSEAPVLALKRIARDPIALGDMRIEPGQALYLLIASANRSPSMGPSDISTSKRALQHLSFGQGRFHCLGAPLARMEIYSVLRRLRGLSIQIDRNRPIAWRKGWLLHEARSIRVTTA